MRSSGYGRPRLGGACLGSGALHAGHLPVCEESAVLKAEEVAEEILTVDRKEQAGAPDLRVVGEPHAVWRPPANNTVDALPRAPRPCCSPARVPTHRSTPAGTSYAAGGAVPTMPAGRVTPQSWVPAGFVEECPVLVGQRWTRATGCWLRMPGTRIAGRGGGRRHDAGGHHHGKAARATGCLRPGAALAAFVRQANVLAELHQFLVPCAGQADWLPPDAHATLAARHGGHGADGQALMARPDMADVEVIRFTCPSWRAGG